MSKKNTKQKKYIVSVSTKFEYPSCVIDSKNRLRDLYSKSWNEFIDRLTNNPGATRDGVEISLEEEVPYKLPFSKEINEPVVLGERIPTDIYHICKLAADFITAEQYGELDPEVNPEIYEFYDEEIRNEDDKVIEVVTHPSLKPEISNFYNEKYHSLRRYILDRVL